MALGALAGALNTMYSSVAARSVEIATLRAIGFGGFPAFVGTMVEFLILAALGGLIGAAATYLFFDGFTASTPRRELHASGVQLQAEPDADRAGRILALSVGLAGGLFPAIRAARMPIVAGLSE